LLSGIANEGFEKKLAFLHSRFGIKSVCETKFGKIMLSTSTV